MNFTETGYGSSNQLEIKQVDNGNSIFLANNVNA